MSSRSKRVVYNMLTAILNMVVVQVVALVVSIKVLEVYGADFHGLNSILSNVMVWVLLLEGGLTTATTVALYKPYVCGDTGKCNSIVSAARQQFQRIGLLIMLVGVIISFGYPLIVKSDIPYWDISLMFLIMTFSTAFGVYFTRKYAVMYSVTQNEYVSHLIGIGISVLGSVVIYFIAISGAHYLWVRIVYMIVTVATGIALCIVIKKKYRFLNFKERPDKESISGTKHVIAQKLTAVIRTSSPSIFISIFDTTVAASIYAVNMYGYNFVRSIMNHVLNSTQSGVGQVVAEKNEAGVYEVFRSFEFVMITVAVWLMVTAMVVMMPFINIYTHNVEGVNYISYFLWIMLPVNYAIQVFHLPSGVIINMNGKFKEDRNFQVITMIVMIVLMLIGGYFFGLNGIVFGATVASIVLAVQEIRYARKHLLHRGYADFLRPLIIDLICFLPIIYLEYKLVPYDLSIPGFFVAGFTLLAINGLLLIGINWIFERDRLKSLYHRFSGILSRRKNPAPKSGN